MNMESVGCSAVKLSLLQLVDGVKTVEGLSGRTLRIPKEWKNPSDKWHIGVKNAFDLYPRGVKDRIWEDLNFQEESFGLEHQQKVAIVNQMAKYRSALALEFDDLGLVKDVKISINTGDADLIKARCRPLAPHLKKPLKEQVDRWLSQGVIAPCDGPWASPIVAVPKKNGGFTKPALKFAPN